jgi:hypothetical protein
MEYLVVKNMVIRGRQKSRNQTAHTSTSVAPAQAGGHGTVGQIPIKNGAWVLWVPAFAGTMLVDVVSFYSAVISAAAEHAVRLRGHAVVI